MKTGLFFGSFNPIHNGHIAIAGYMLEFTDLEEVWFVVSPHNPLKEQSELAPDNHRLNMVRLAIEEYQPKISLCDIEMSMPRPSYTIDTLKALKAKHPEREFTVLMGADPRLGSNTSELKTKYNVVIINAPIMEISSTFLRKAISQGKRVDYFMPPRSYQYLLDNKIY
jgi:nicotinate-nucleotide adenylyltransferase